MEKTSRRRRYVEALFAVEDDVLREVRQEIKERGLPEISVSAEVGRVLQVLLRSVAARRVLEVGTLGGYSAIWMARALPEDGRLLSLEIDADRAALARQMVERAGLTSKVEVRLGDARAETASLASQSPGSFDAVFIDADKESYIEYLNQALQLVRPGGLIIADNAFWDDRVLDAEDAGSGDSSPDAATDAMRSFNRRIADEPGLTATILPVRDGLAVAVVSH